MKKTNNSNTDTNISKTDMNNSNTDTNTSKIDMNNSNTMTSAIPSIDYADLIQYAPHSEEYPQKTNDKGQVIRGTALASYMGYKHSMIEWKDKNGDEQQVPKLALIFAIRLVNGSFKLIPAKLAYACFPGSNLEIALKAIGVTPEYETIVTDKDDELFGTITTLNHEKLETDL